MGTGRNTYSGGLDSDTNNAKIQTNKLRDLVDLRVYTDKGETSLALASVKGNKKMLELPSIKTIAIKDGLYKGDNLPFGHNILLTEDFLPSYHRGKIITTTANSSSGVYNGNILQYSYYSNRDSLDLGNSFISKNDHKIIGWTTMRDDLIVFSSTSSSSAPDSTARFCIWRITYDNDLNYTIQMMYVGAIPHSTYYMLEAHSRHENNKVEKVYWTDAKETVKHFNLGAYSPHDISNNQLEFTPNGDYYAPKFVSFISGEPEKKGMVQYAYSLFTRSGSESKISPLSLPFYIKDLQVSFSFWADLSFNNARIYRVHYANSTDIPTVTLMEDIPYIPQENNYIEVSDIGQTLATVSLTEFSNLGGDPKVVETIAEKDNRLFLGGITEKEFDLDWDARAYRFDSSSNCKIYKANGKATDSSTYSLEKLFTNSNYPTLIGKENTFDCFNISNLDLSVTGYDGGYKFQSNGGTLGGEGPNIQYTFGTGKRPFGFTRETVHSGYSSLYQDYVPAKGYKRMEIYRFGIQFLNEYGQWSFVKWIGDIKFPSSHLDLDGEVQIPYLSVKLKALPAGWKAGWKWRIVRAKRKQADRTIATQGFMMQGVKPLWQVDAVAGTGTKPAPYAQADTFSYPFHGPGFQQGNSSSTYHGALVNGTSYPEQEFTSDYGINYLVSHEGHYVDISSKDGDYFYPMASAHNYVASGRTEPIEFKSDQATSGVKKFYHRRLDHKLWDNVAYPDDNDKRYMPENIEKLTVQNKLYELGDYSTRNSMWNRVLFSPFVGGASTESYICSGTNVIAWTSSGLPTGGGSFSIDKPCVIDFRKIDRNQYGGYAHHQRSVTEYIPCSELFTSRFAYETVYGGDTATALCRILKASFDETWANTYGLSSNKQIVECVLETSVIPAFEDLENQNMFGEFKTQKSEFFKFDNVYTKESEYPTYISKPINFNEVTNFDFIIKASEPKFNNEIIDSYTRYLTNVFLELDPRYGPIKKLINHKDEIICFQHAGVSHIAINPRVQTTGSDSKAIQLGTGGVLHDKKYITTKSGTLNKWSVFASKNTVYYYDALQNKIKVVGSDMEISDVKNIHGELKKINFLDDYSLDRPLQGYGVIGQFDNEFAEALFTFKSPQISESMVLVYKEALNGGQGAFAGKYRYNPYSLLSDNRSLLSIDPANSNSIYIHNKGDVSSYYNASAEQSYFHIIVNAGTDISKIFDNWTFNMEAKNVNGSDLPAVHPHSCRVYNDYQDSGIVPFTNFSNIARLQRTWEANIPRQQNSRLTMRGPWLNVIFYFDNTNNYEYVMHDLYTKFRP
jgi:hypothetical protein